MTCNPFTNVVSKNSNAVLDPSALADLSFDDILDFENEPTAKYDKDKLKDIANLFDKLVRRTDLTNFPVTQEKITQLPTTINDIAEFLDNSSRNIDDVLDTLRNEDARRNFNNNEKPVKEGIITGIGVDSFDNSFPPGIYEDQKDENGNGSFDVIIANNGLPLINIRNPGEGYNSGDTISLPNVGGLVLSVTDTANLERNFTPVEIAQIFGKDNLASSIGELTNFVQDNFFDLVDQLPQSVLDNINDNLPPDFENISDLDREAIRELPLDVIYDIAAGSNISDNNSTSQNFNDLLNSFEFFTNQSIGPALKNKTCKGVNFGILAKLFEVVSTLDQYILQGTNLVNDIWDAAKGIINFDLPGLLKNLKDQLFGIIDQIKQQAMQMIEGFKSKIAGIASSISNAFAHLSKKLANVANFFKDENMNKVKNLVDSMMKKMNDQFSEVAIGILMWILSRMCGISSFLNDFLMKPLEEFNKLLSKFEQVKNTFKSISDFNIKGAINAGVARVNFDEERKKLDGAVSSPNFGAQGPGARAASIGGGEGGSMRPSQYVTVAFTEQEKSFIAGWKQTWISDPGSGQAGIPGLIIPVGGTLHPDNNVDFAGNPVNNGGLVMIRDEVWMILIRVAKRMGTQLQITSGYRSKKRNANLAKTTKGVAKGSLHQTGEAADIVLANKTADNIANFIKHASQEGFGGISHYANSNNKFTHVDIGGRRTWGGGGNAAVIAEAIRLHANDLHRKGPAADSYPPAEITKPSRPI
jgi:hypothetical protein